MGTEERKIVVNTKELLETLKKNREQHLAEYNEAVEGYLSAANSKLQSQYKKAQHELEKAFNRTKQELKSYDPTNATDTIIFCRGIQFDLVAPRNYAEVYDQSIQMMEWETREAIELNSTEFRCFVMNKWDWMESFKNVSVMYGKYGK
jgi:hypothetical protein